MKTIKTESQVMELPLDKIVIGKAQVRTTVSIDQGIKDLAESIKKIGLLEPIIVSRVGEDKYEILAGQRRFLAHQYLNAKSIKAIVTESTLDEIEAKVVSLTENLLREDIPLKNKIDVCTLLFKRYGSTKMISEETGLQEKDIKEYIKYPRLIKPLQGLVDSGEVKLKVALRAQDAASVTGKINEEEAIKLAKEMEPMSGQQQSSIVKAKQNNPKKSADDVIEEAKSGKTTQVIVTLGPNAHEALQKFAKEEDTTQDDAARSLIEGGLKEKGFLEAE